MPQQGIEDLGIIASCLDFTRTLPCALLLKIHRGLKQDEGRQCGESDDPQASVNPVSLSLIAARVEL